MSATLTYDQLIAKQERNRLLNDRISKRPPLTPELQTLYSWRSWFHPGEYPDEQDGFLDIPVQPHGTMLGQHGSFFNDYVSEKFPEFYNYLVYHNQVVDFFYALQTIVREEINRRLEFELSKYMIPRFVYKSPEQMLDELANEEAEDRIYASELRAAGKSEDFIRNALNRRHDKRHQFYDGNPSAESKLTHQLLPGITEDVYFDLVYVVFPRPQDLIQR